MQKCTAAVVVIVILARLVYFTSPRLKLDIVATQRSPRLSVSREKKRDETNLV